MNPKLSVIIPVYNSEATLVRCIESVLKQSFKDWEMLLIDDGSSDRSGEICDNYSKEEPRIIVFHSSNKGCSSARNLGLDKARGERITFIDSDDEILSGFFETALNYDEDVISGSTEQISTKIIDAIDEVPSPSVFLGHKDIFENVLRKGPRFSGPCSMIWKRLIIGEIRFNTSMRFGEDSLFSVQCLNKANSVRTLSDTVYRYYVPNDMSIKYKMHVEEAVTHLSLFYSITDRIPNMDLFFCADRYRALFSASFRDVYYRPWVFAHNKVMNTYFMKYSLYFPQDFREYYKQWFTNWPYAYLNLLTSHIRKRLSF